ncbi:xylose isomerase, partial [Klebsiella quasipneumoniae]|nr:xylose isomerase [Klebsiella quasipneumoniae]
VWKERKIRNDCQHEPADFNEKANEESTLSENVIHDVMQKWGPRPQIAMAATQPHNAAFEPKRKLDFMPRIHNNHAKY